jgi:hypothetical protein
MDRFEAGLRRLERPRALVRGTRHVAGKAVLQHFLQEGIRRVAAGHAVSRDGIEDLGTFDAAPLARRTAAEMESQCRLAHQPAMLAAEHRREPGIAIVGLLHEPRLLADGRVQAGMAGNVVGRQSHVDGLARFRHSHRFQPELEP